MKQFLRSWKYSIPAGIALAAVVGFLVFVDRGADDAPPAGAAPAATDAASVVGEAPVVAPTTAPAPAAPDTAAPAPTTPATTTPAPPVIVTEATGSFVPLDYQTSGEAIVLGDGTGARFLRFEEFATDNGPDLKVYLVNSAAAGGADDPANVIDLGDLESIVGDQTYVIPVGADLSTFDTVVIWCVQFSSPFGEAVLLPA